jgi:hypothetical protein
VHRLLTALALSCAVLGGGCSAQSPFEPGTTTYAAKAGGGGAGQPALPPADGRADGAGGEAAKPAAQRRIIHTATLELLVEDIEKARQELLGLVEESKGFVAGSEAGGTPGAPRTGRWTVRVPAAGFAVFLEAAARLGEALHSRTDTQDVTEQFVDLEARLKNKRIEEERLQQHLKTSTGKLEDVLAVERELSRVRGEIEQAQGRLQKLADLTELSTVTVTLRERGGYVPPRSPAFGTTVGRTFSDSLGLLVDAGKWLVLAAVALVPWLPVLALVGGVGWLVARRWRSRATPAGASGGK